MNREDAKTQSIRVIGEENLTDIQRNDENVASQIVDAAFSIHKSFGPGLLESVYEQFFCIELKERSIPYVCQKQIPVEYKGFSIETGFRLDVLVNDRIIVELKACESISPVHRAQLLTYLKLSGKELGFLINFNVPLIKDGIVRVVNRQSNLASLRLRDSTAQKVLSS
jgi:GxxExxY protein